MLFVPREPFSSALPGLAPPRAVPSDLVLAVLTRALPADIVQKAVLLSIFVLACAGMAVVCESQPVLARLAAGVFYAWNPYVAERLIIGHWALLLGYAGLPWVLRAVTRPDLASWRGAARLALVMVPAVVGGFAAMTVTALVVVPAALLSGSVKRAATALGLLAAGSLPWLIPSLLHPVYADPAGSGRVRGAGRHAVRRVRQPADAGWGMERADGAEGIRRRLVGAVARRRAGRAGGFLCSAGPGWDGAGRRWAWPRRPGWRWRASA